MIIILMGVAGAGKTTVGELLATDLNWPYYEGDTFHPPQNVAKMALGVPLTDEDRRPWLRRLRRLIEETLEQGASAILGCSALKRAYRQQLCVDDEAVKFVYLKGSYELIEDRLEDRQGHYMKSDLLASQFEALEEPQNALEVDIDQTPEAIVEEIKRTLL